MRAFTCFFSHWSESSIIDLNTVSRFTKRGMLVLMLRSLNLTVVGSTSSLGSGSCSSLCLSLSFSPSRSRRRHSCCFFRSLACLSASLRSLPFLFFACAAASCAASCRCCFSRCSCSSRLRCTSALLCLPECVSLCSDGFGWQPWDWSTLGLRLCAGDFWDWLALSLLSPVSPTIDCSACNSFHGKTCLTLVTHWSLW